MSVLNKIYSEIGENKAQSYGRLRKKTEKTIIGTINNKSAMASHLNNL